jgi:DNA-binding PadR family transcriptional regulator
VRVLTATETIILGLLFENDYYGYEIEEIIKERGMRDWTEIGFSSIYNALSKAEKAGLVISKYDKQYGSPKRKIYSLTATAKTDFLEEVKRMLSNPKRVYSEFDIGMAYSNLLDENEFKSCIEEYQKSLEIRMNNLQKKYRGNPELQKHANIKALFTRPLHLIAAEIDWITSEFKNRSTEI